MKYNDNQLMEEILRRGEAVADRRNRKRFRILQAASGAMLVLLIAAIVGLTGWAGTDANLTSYGALLLSEEAGGYVLAGTIAFALGVAVTIFCLWQKRRHMERTREEELDKKEAEEVASEWEDAI